VEAAKGIDKLIVDWILPKINYPNQGKLFSDLKASSFPQIPNYDNDKDNNVSLNNLVKTYNTLTDNGANTGDKGLKGLVNKDGSLNDAKLAEYKQAKADYEEIKALGITKDNATTYKNVLNEFKDLTKIDPLTDTETTLAEEK
jgi:hypothetical protein